MSGTFGIPPESLLSSEVIVNNLRMAANAEHFRREAIKQLMNNAVEFFAYTRVKEHRGDFQTTFRLQAYVLSPDDLHRMVAEEAAKLQTCFRSAPVQPDPPSEWMAQRDELLAAQQDHDRLVRELDVLLNGEEGAARQASLCDLVAQLKAKGGAA